MLKIYLLLVVLGLSLGLETGSTEDVHELSVDKKKDGVRRPCPILVGSCVRKNLAKMSTCTPVYKSKKGQIPVNYLDLPLTHANATFIWDGADMTGLDKWKIMEFYVNKETNKVVMGVFFDEVTIKGNSHLRFYLKGRAPETLTSNFSFTYKKASITATMPYDQNYGIYWQRMYAFTYVEVSNVVFDAGSGLTTTDPEVQAGLDEVFADISTGLKEVSQNYGQYVFKSFLNNNLCKL